MYADSKQIFVIFSVSRFQFLHSLNSLSTIFPFIVGFCVNVIVPGEFSLYSRHAQTHSCRKLSAYRNSLVRCQWYRYQKRKKKHRRWALHSLQSTVNYYIFIKTGNMRSTQGPYNNIHRLKFNTNTLNCYRYAFLHLKKKWKKEKNFE